MNDDVVTITQDNAGDAAPSAAPAAAPTIADPALADVAVLTSDDEDEDNFPEQAIRNPDGSVTLPLNVPVALKWKAAGSDVVNEDPPITQLVMRRLTGKDVRTILGGGMGDTYLVKLTGACVRGMTEVKPARWPLIFDRMDGSDTQAAVLIAQDFLANGPKTPGG